jgi:cell division protein FtsN
LKWYGAGVITGVFLSFMVYLGTLPAEVATGESAASAEEPQETAPRPRFDFYTLLPEQTIDVEVDPAEVTAPREGASATREVYVLQAGSFRQREDADRRRAELLLLGLQPEIEETSGDNGRWFRVYLGPFDSRSKMSKARSLTAGQDIDTLVLKRDPR